MRELRIPDSDLAEACTKMPGVPLHVPVNLFFERRLREAGFTLRRSSAFGSFAPEPEARVEVWRDEMTRETVVVERPC